MTSRPNSILLLGESGVGKTHYGAQLLRRLMHGDGVLRMNGQATNLEPFQAALESLDDGRAAAHTATSTYLDSVWPIEGPGGEPADLIWPDYGGEQVKNIIETRRVPAAWRGRVTGSPAWLLLLRLQQLRVGDDIFSRPMEELKGASSDKKVQMSDQARMIELLQMLTFVGSLGDRPFQKPRISVLLTCWDELGFTGRPTDALRERLPMLWSFIRSNWREPFVLGLSALERPLNPNDRDPEYVAQGPGNFGYVIRPDGSRTTDLTLPIQMLLEERK